MFLVFPGGEIVDIARSGPAEAGGEGGRSRRASFSVWRPDHHVHRQRREARFYLHAGIFPFLSTVKTEQEIERLFSALVEGGANADAIGRIRLQPPFRMGQRPLRDRRLPGS